MRREEAIMFIIMVTIIGGGMQAMMTQGTRIMNHNIYPVYSMTAPFGFFSVQGELGGSFLFFDGYIKSSENYDVKYFDGDRLKTVICNAEETDVIVDGELLLESIETIETFRFLIFKLGLKPTIETKYIIHIPYLPDVDSITEDWDDS